jgi:putative DNA-invertase from lambdoid prophage Rac
MAVYGYVRVSTQSQAADGESLDVQRRQIQGRAMQENWMIDEVFVERGISDSKTFGDREQGAALLARLQRGDIVVAAKLDRTFRSALDAFQTCDRLQRDGVSLFLLDLGGDLTGNGVAGLFMKIAAFAEFERDRLRERIRDAKQDPRSRGLHLGGHRPFGYCVDADRRLVPPGPRGAGRDRPHQGAAPGRPFAAPNRPYGARRSRRDRISHDRAPCAVGVAAAAGGASMV